MKRKILSILLALSMSLTVLAACTETPNETPDEPDTPEVVDPVEPETPEEPEVVEPAEPVYTETEVGAENTLNSAGETITLNVVDNKLYITNVATLKSGANMAAENSEFVLPAHGVVNDEDVALTWKFVSCIKFENKEVNDVLTDGLVYHFEEASQNLKMRVYCVTRPELSGPFEIYSELDNLNSEEYRIKIKSFSNFSVNIPDPANTTIMQIAKEGIVAQNFGHSIDIDAFVPGEGIYLYNFAETKLCRATTSTAESTTVNGYFLAYYSDRNATDGLLYAYEWTNGIMTMKKNGENTANVTVTMDLVGKYSTRVAAEDTFLFPSTYIFPYDGSVDDGSNIYKSWFFDCKVNPKLRDDPSEPKTQTDHLDTWYDISEAKDVGFESVKWDYGWWSNIEHHTADVYYNEGAWVPLADGQDAPSMTVERLTNYANRAKELGINFTAYVLLHDTYDINGNPTDEYGEFNSLTHPEWFTNYDDTADLGNVELVGFLKEKLQKLFSTYNISTWRTDFEPIAINSDKENRHDANGADVSYWTTIGFGEIIDHLYDTVDGFRFESCSSGGGQKDLWTATKAVVINCDDSLNYLSLRASFYDSSYLIHPSQLQQPCNPDEFTTTHPRYFPQVAEPVVKEGDSYDFYGTMLDMGFRSTMMGVPHWMSRTDWYQISYKSYYTEYLTMYAEKVRPLVREAELYHILPRPDGTNWDGIMYADPDSENEIKGLVFLFKPSEEAENVKNVVFDGLYEDTLYQLTFEDRPEQNCTATGAELMTNGIDVEIKYVGSELIWITEATNN